MIDLTPLHLNENLPSNRVKIGITANSGLHTNELICGVSFALEGELAAGNQTAKDISFVWKNDGRCASKASQIAEEFAREGVRFVIGHLSASASVPASEIYTRTGVCFFATGTTHPELCRENKPYVLRFCPLDTELHDMLWLGCSCQLGIQHLIAEITQTGRYVALDQKVSIAPPRRRKEHGLINHIRTGLHSLQCQLGAVLQVTIFGDFNDRIAFVFELLEIRRLMLQAFLLQQLSSGAGLSLIHILAQRLNIKEARMVTPQKGDQVRWRIKNLIVAELLHGLSACCIVRIKLLESYSSFQYFQS